jgi:hypothetical protein
MSAQFDQRRARELVEKAHAGVPGWLARMG